MNQFLAGTDVKLSIPLIDADGNPLAVSAVAYRVTDAAGTELIAWANHASFVPDAPEVEITVPAASNALAAGVVRDVRGVDLKCIIDTNTVLINSAYVIHSGDVLVTGVNTFQTLPAARVNAQMMPDMGGWNQATDDERIAALIDARLHICQLNFAPLSNGRFWGQDSLNFIPEGSYEVSSVIPGGMWAGDLSDLTPSQYNALPLIFRDRLKLAQLAEANFILGGDPLSTKRRAGIVLETVGESKMMFNSGKELQLPVCARAASYLSRFISFSKRIIRS